MSSKATALFRVRHTKNAQNKLDLAHDALATIGAEVLGSGDRLKTQAMEVILETADGLQTISRPMYSDVRPAVTSGTSLLDQIVSEGRLAPRTGRSEIGQGIEPLPPHGHKL
jgi:hypothetical protein